MGKMRRIRKAPFVITVSAIGASTFACGGTALVTDNRTDGAGGSTSSGGFGGVGPGGSTSSGATGGAGGYCSPPGACDSGAVGGASGVGVDAGVGVGGTGASGGTGGATFGGTGGVGGLGGLGGVGGKSGEACPALPPSPSAACALTGNDTCTYVLSCQSGPVIFEYQCVHGRFALSPATCTSPYDSCPATGLWCSEGWFDYSVGTNPPMPCPNVRPTDGALCYVGLGGHQSPCGYSCGTSGGWTVMSCVAHIENAGRWTSDGACDDGGT